MREFAAQPPALAILDVGLPDLNGFELFKQLQALPGGDQVPMLFLTARSDEIDRVVGLELGADDYVAKPFSPRELVARVRTILRRSVRPGTGRDRCAGRSACASPSPSTRNARKIRYYGRAAGTLALRIRPPAALVQRPGRVFTRDELLSQGLGRQQRQLRPHRRRAHQDPARQAQGGGARARGRSARLRGIGLRAEPKSFRRECRRGEPTSKRNRIFIGILLIFAAGVGLHAVPRGGRPRSALPRVGRGVAGRDRAADGQPGGAGRARRRDRHQRGWSRCSSRSTRASSRPTSSASPSGGSSCGLRHRPQRPRAVRFARAMSRRRLLAMARRHAGAAPANHGARTTPDVESDPATSVMYVGAPVRWNNEIVGAVSVGKPVQSFGQFVEAARRKTLLRRADRRWPACCCWPSSFRSGWCGPFGLIGDYVRYVRAQRALQPAAPGPARAGRDGRCLR